MMCWKIEGYVKFRGFAFYPSLKSSHFGQLKLTPLYHSDDIVATDAKAVGNIVWMYQTNTSVPPHLLVLLNLMEVTRKKREKEKEIGMSQVFLPDGKPNKFSITE